MTTVSLLSFPAVKNKLSRMIYHRLTKRNNNRGISIISRAFPSNNQDKVKFVEVVFVLVAAITLCTRSLKRKLKQWLVIMLEIYDRCWYLKNYPTTIQEIQLNRILTSSLSNNVIILPLYCDYSFFLTKVYMLAGKGCIITMKLTPKFRYWIKKFTTLATTFSIIIVSIFISTTISRSCVTAVNAESALYFYATLSARQT